jgi:beta-lactamase class A
MITLIALSFCLFQHAGAQQNKLKTTVAEIAADTRGKIGVYARVLEGNQTFEFNNDQHFVMQSVFKFPIAVMLLSEVDKGKLKLDQQLFIPKSKIKKTISKLYEKYPEGNVSVPLREILEDMVLYSDNNACDVLLQLLKGPKALTGFLHGIGITDINVDFDEWGMQKKWNNQYQNWCTPQAQVTLLSLVFEQKILKSQTNTLLRSLMRETYVAPMRIRGLLPKGTLVEHRTGTSSINDSGLSPATNDVGTITLANGKHLAIAIFLMDSYENSEKRDLVIAKIAKAAFDEFSGVKPQ